MLQHSTYLLSVCGSNGFLRVLEQEEEVKVGVAGADRELLIALHSAETVRISFELWGMLVNKIAFAPIARMILAAGSPQARWRAFTTYYETRAGVDKAELRRNWHDLQQGESEDPREFFARASVLLTRLQSYVTTDELESNYHIANALSSEFPVEASILQASDNVTFLTMKETAVRAHDRKEAKRMVGRSEYGGVAFVASGPGRGHGARGSGPSGRERQQQRQQQQQEPQQRPAGRKRCSWHH